jgi:hypothetical protein
MRKSNIILSLGAIMAPACLFAGWLPTGGGDFYYTNTVNWTDGVINDVYDAAFSGKATQNVLFDDSYDFKNGITFTHPGEITTVFRGQGGNVTVRLLGDIEINKSANGSKGSLTFGSNTDGQHLDIDLGGGTRTIHNANLDVYLRNTFFNGDLRIQNGNWAYFAGAGGIPAGTLEIAPVATFVFDSSTWGVAGGTRAGSVRLARSTLLARGNNGADAVDTVAGAIVVDGSFGGTSFISVNPGGKSETLSATAIERDPGAPLSISGASLGAGRAKLILDTPPTLVGGDGTAGTTSISIVPGMVGSATYRAGVHNDYALSFLTYDSATGFRPLDLDTEFVQETDFPVGQITTANVRLAYGSATEITAETTINALLFQGADATAADTVITGTETLHVTSGQIILGYNRFGANRVGAPIDFGASMGFIEYPQGKGSFLSGAISGTGGVVFYQASVATSGAGLEVSGTGHTWTGNTYVQSQLAADDNVLPGRDRTGDIWLNGVLFVNGGTYNGLNGCGSLRHRNSGPAGVISFGDNNADGDFTGDVTPNLGKFIIHKIGTGTQRFACSSMAGLDGVVVDAGTLILDGTLNESSVTVAGGASFGGGGAIAAGGVSFGEGCTFVVRVDNGEPSCLDVSGAVAGSQIVVDATVLSGKWKEAQCVLKSGEAISATFKRGEGIRSLELRNNATELWAMPKRDGFAVVIR